MIVLGGISTNSCKEAHPSSQQSMHVGSAYFFSMPIGGIKHAVNTFEMIGFYRTDAFPISMSGRYSSLKVLV